MEIFKLFGSIFVDNDQANQSISATEKKAGGLGEKLGAGIKTAAKWGAAIAAGAVVAGGAIFALANKTAEYADEIDKLSERTGINREELQRWKYAAEQSGADIGKLETGMKTLSNTMDDATNGSKKAITGFEKLGISMDDLKTKSQEDIFSDMMKSLADMPAGAERNALGNDLLGKSYTELLPLLNAGSEGMAELMTRADELGLVMSEEAVMANVKFGDTLADVKNSFGALFRGISNEFLPVLQSMLDWILAHMPQIQATFKVVFDVVGAVINTAIDWIKQLIDMGKEWYSNNEETLTAIKDSFMLFVDSIINFVQSFIELFLQIWQEYGDEITLVFQAIWDTMVTILDVAITLIKDIFNIFAAVFRGDWDGLWNGIKTLFSNYWSGIGEILEKYIDYFKTVFNLFGEVLSDAWNGIWTGIKDFFFDIWDGIVNGIKGYINSIVRAINVMVNGINNIGFDVPDWVPGIGGKSWGFNIPSVPYLAEGGDIVKSGYAVVGDAGPELIELNAGARVTPLDQTQRSVIIEINNPKFFNQDDVDNMMEPVIKRLKALGVAT